MVEPARRAGDQARRLVNAVEPDTRIKRGVGLLVLVLLAGTLGYLALGLDLIDAMYQTVTTVSTVGFRELGEATTAWKLFTMVIVLLGASTVLYTISAVFDVVIEGHLGDQLWRRRMQRDIAGFERHVIICGIGRVGQAIATYLANAGQAVVVVDLDESRLRTLGQPFVRGDATDDDVLRRAGIERASTLIAAADTDADNLYITLSARSLRADLFIVARARTASAEPKLVQAGANRVVNPQLIGGARMAALTLQPHVSEFLDVVMHDGRLEFRLEEVAIPEDSPLCGRTVRSAHIRDRTGAMVLAIRRPDGSFLTNPDPDTAIEGGVVLIAIGTREQLAALGHAITEGE